MTTELPLKYGCNPNQPTARILFDGPDDCPLTVANGSPSFINALDGLRGWELVRDLKTATNKPAAASFKHVSPAGAAVAGELTDSFCAANFYPAPSEHGYSPIAAAYAKARSSDRGASFGDFIAVSETIDASLAKLIKPEVSDGIIAPGYDDDAKAILAAKKGGKYVMLQIDPGYAPASGSAESRTCFGLTLEQTYNDAVIDKSLLSNITTDKKELPDSAAESLLVATATLKHTQSNSIAVAMDGQAIGVGAGQQSRIACTRLACDKADRFMLKQHPKSLALIGLFKDGVKRPDKVNAVDQFVRYHELDDIERGGLLALLSSGPDPITPDEANDWCANFGDGQLALSSDAFIPFRDNLDRAARSGVKYVVHAGGSARDDLVTDAANEHGMVMAMSGLRLFLH
ncbi:MAG: phosphoribosylaminoimidazolecarboxamide formyltransferase [Phycisphaeraceae bacterium]|nr:phosphoribosylaminoimidazolecarboxamide formyltransferase [Phycisphaeraceae bacterium]